MHYMKIEDRFWGKVHKAKNVADCWLWTASHYKNGYGQFRISTKRNGYAHIFSWILHHGLDGLDKNICVLHRCDVRDCVNPLHLFLGTNQDNCNDKVAKKRQNFGSKHPMAKLTEGIVEKIRSSLLSQKKLALMHDVSEATISNIINNKSWRS